MRTRRWLIALTVLALATGVWLVATPMVRAAALVVRAAELGGRPEAVAHWLAGRVTTTAAATFRARAGEVPIQVYEPAGGARRTTLLIPGIHSLGIREPRLTALAEDLAGSGVRVITLALPDLMTYRITPQATDVIEDALAWAAARDEWAPDGRVGVVGVSFAGGLALVAASRPAVRDKVAFVVSFGGHGDLPRVLRYLATGDAPVLPGLQTQPPHDYGLAVLLHGLTDAGVVPATQAQALREGVDTFLLASQLTLVDEAQARATFARARELATGMPEPAATYMAYVNDRDTGRLGQVVAPLLTRLGADNPSLSSARSASVPAAPVFLLHGYSDTVIPAAESVLLADQLQQRGVSVRVLISRLITHAEVDRTAAASEAWTLVRFWADVLRR